MKQMVMDRVVELMEELILVENIMVEFFERKLKDWYFRLLEN